MKKIFLAVATLALVFSASQAVRAADAERAAGAEAPLSAHSLDEVKDLSRQLLTLANKHDVPAIRQMFWNSPSALIVAKSVDPAEGNWAGFWGIDAVSKKIQDIADGGPVQLYPDYTKMKAVGLTADVAETYIPMNIAVSYGGQDPAPRPFLMILEWVKVAGDWKIASEIILPVPPAPAAAHPGSHAG
ncbi:hypothetical protein D9O50_00445 [Oxalobacteraceae bacterium CAVE-383]|nr:hypothetical protein D9O50_00445 [Oxalobacteraceae bacterium CAVE-383]